MIVRYSPQDSNKFNLLPWGPVGNRERTVLLGVLVLLCHFKILGRLS